ncbi:tetratricopeptide repeat protein [Janibacter alkaliphilus]
MLVEATDATFEQIVARSTTVPAVGVVWSSQHPESKQLLDETVAVAQGLEGRLQVVGMDVATNPGLMQALQPQQVPMAIGLLGGQAVHLLTGMPERQQLTEVLDQLLAAAVQNGITGRVQVSAEDASEATDGGADELPPLHQEAFDAIERDDLDAAASAYERALAENPKDAEASAGLAQVGLMRRTQGVDLDAARRAAADDPTDIDAALVVADLDVLGGHVEDGFTRLIDLVRTTAGDDRERVRTHLVGLFDVVGNHDERVRKGRTALMSALF